jgi:hypothetical protein
MSLPTTDDDVVLWNDPNVVAAVEGKNNRKADAGDFDTTKDTRITQYFQNKLNGARPEQQIKNIIKPVVTIWARDFPNYQSKQLGTNFTGRNSIGGLFVALGSNPNIPMGKVMSLLTKCVKEMRPRDWLCEELEQSWMIRLRSYNARAPPPRHTSNNNTQRKNLPLQLLLKPSLILLIRTPTLTLLTTTPPTTPL